MNDPTWFEIVTMLMKEIFMFGFVSVFALKFHVQVLVYPYIDLSPELEALVISRLDILPHYIFNYLKGTDIYVAIYEDGKLIDLKPFIPDPSLVHPETATYWRTAIRHYLPTTQEGVHIFDLDYPNKKRIRFYARIPAQPAACPFELDPMNTPIPKELLPPEWQVEPLTSLREPRPRPIVFPPELGFPKHALTPPPAPAPTIPPSWLDPNAVD